MQHASGLDELIAAAEAVADIGGTIVRPFFRAAVMAELKSDDSPVTVADRNAEQAMRAELTRRFPDQGILGEEFGLERPGADLRWVLDPIDGTRAFITGRPTFGTLIALLKEGAPILGIIDQPITGERWIGVAGRRTVFRGPFGGRPGCRICSKLGEAELSATSPDMFSSEGLPRWQKLQANVRRTSFGGDCYAYGLLALGQIDVIAEAGMKIWDWAALVPVVEGAGGSLTDWQGRPLTVASDGHTLALGDPALIEEVGTLLSD